MVEHPIVAAPNGAKSSSSPRGAHALSLLASHVAKEADEHEKLREEVHRERAREKQEERQRRGSRHSIDGGSDNIDRSTARRSSKDGVGPLAMLAFHIVKETEEQEKLKEDVLKEREREKEAERLKQGSADSVEGEHSKRRRHSRSSRNSSPVVSPRASGNGRRMSRDGAGPLALLAGHIATHAEEQQKLKDAVHEEREKDKQTARRRRGSRSSRDGSIGQQPLQPHNEQRRGSRDGAGALFMLAGHIATEQENMQQVRESARQAGKEAQPAADTRRGRRRIRDSGISPRPDRDDSSNNSNTTQRATSGPLFMLATHVHRETESIEKTRAEVAQDRGSKPPRRKRPSLLISQKSLRKIEKLKEAGADPLIALEMTKMGIEALTFRELLTESDQKVFDGAPENTPLFSLCDMRMLLFDIESK